MGHYTLNWSKEEKDLLEEIISRREKLLDGKIWKRHDWDYTEWEEAWDEYETKRKRLSRQIQ